jgi:hypothetical protein
MYQYLHIMFLVSVTLYFFSGEFYCVCAELHYGMVRNEDLI